MKRYLILSALVVNLNAIAGTAMDDCNILRNELRGALTMSNLASAVLSEENLVKCFKAKTLVSNNYDGTSYDNYNIFMDNLHQATYDIVQVMNVSDQVDENLRQSNGSLEESQSSVNAIKVLRFSVLGEKFNAVITSFGDDDYFVTTVFVGDSPEIILMRAE